MQNIKISLLLPLIMLVFQPAAYAAERWYRVELIIMEHKDKSGVTLEEWPIDPGYPEVKQAHYLNSFVPEQPQPDNFIELPKESYALTQAKDSLIKHTGNKVLLHTAWRQRVSENNPEPLRLLGGKTYPYSTEDNDDINLNEFDGTLTVLLSKYLHVKTDLVFHKPMRVLAKTSSYAHDNMQMVSPLSSENTWQSQKNTELQRFRLTESRKIMKNEVLYIDHPLYGIMIRISDDKQAS